MGLEYLPKFGVKLMVNVRKYFIQGAYYMGKLDYCFKMDKQNFGPVTTWKMGACFCIFAFSMIFGDFLCCTLSIALFAVEAGVAPKLAENTRVVFLSAKKTGEVLADVLYA